MTATATQIGHWRAMRPRRKAVLKWMRKWYRECGCQPSLRDAVPIFGITVRQSIRLTTEARAVLAEIADRRRKVGEIADSVTLQAVTR